jgi:hypothetical protein
MIKNVIETQSISGAIMTQESIRDRIHIPITNQVINKLLKINHVLDLNSIILCNTFTDICAYRLQYA